MQSNVVVLVDNLGHDLFDQDGRLCTMDKITAHRQGLLHSAVSVFIFNDISPFVWLSISGGLGFIFFSLVSGDPKLELTKE